MKIDGHGGLSGLIKQPKAGDIARSGAQAGEKTSFEEVLKGRCEQITAPGSASPAEVSRAVNLAASNLDLLEEISRKLEGGVGSSGLAPAHERLAQRAGDLARLSEKLPEGPLKELATETAALSYVQLWRFEQGEFS